MSLQNYFLASGMEVFHSQILSSASFISLILLLLSGIYNPYEFEPPHSGGSEITHKDAPQSVGLLWTSDQPVAETST